MMTSDFVIHLYDANSDLVENGFTNKQVQDVLGFLPTPSGRSRAEYHTSRNIELGLISQTHHTDDVGNHIYHLTVKGKQLITKIKAQRRKDMEADRRDKLRSSVEAHARPRAGRREELQTALIEGLSAVANAIVDHIYPD
jgi:hypothetical protein